MARDYQTVGQHLVSRVLLSQFADNDGRLTTHWLDGRTHLQSVAKAARQNDFIAVDADRYEQIWVRSRDQRETLSDS